MATLNIAEFRSLGANSRGGLAPIAQLPTIATQNVAIGSSSTLAATPLNAKTNMIRLTADAACCVEVGPAAPAAAPAATTTKLRIPAGGVEYFGIEPGKTPRVAVIAAA